MAGRSGGGWENLGKAMADLAALRRFQGPPKEFWPAFLGAVGQLTAADQLVLLARKPGEAWGRMADWPPRAAASRLLTDFGARLEELAGRAVRDGRMMDSLDPREGPKAGNFVIGARIPLAQAEECALVGVISEVNERTARDALVRLSLAANTPEFHQVAVEAQESSARVERLSSVLDLNVSVGAEKRFFRMALVFCNSVATRFGCDRVSLGWLRHGTIRLRALSRTEHFDRQTAAAQALETAMEEAADQDCEIVWPVPAGSTEVARDHERYASGQEAGNVCSLPLRSGEEVVAVLTCERRDAPFTESELQQLRLGCDLATARLAELEERDRWFGARWAGRSRQLAAKLLGPEHTWAKIFSLLGVAVLATLVFLRVPYRVDGNFVLKSDQTAYLSAPYDGYIDEVYVRPGDTVKAGEPLLKLKTSEMELNEAVALADVNRYQRQAEKARAARQLADMRVAEAMAAQAEARLKLVRYHLREATIRAPFDGVVIEGDLRERLGAPVKQADVLFKVARISTLYVQASVSERDIREILGRTAGEIAFVARPKLTFPVRITMIEKAAVAKPDGNVFRVRCAFQGGDRRPWWRPGMSGVCRFPAGDRALGWILTHRTVDFLRLHLWW